MEKINQVTLLNDRQPFYEYVSSHPHLYDGVDLTGAEIDYINNEFWFMDVNPGNFQPIFVHKIRKYITQYKNMKAIEFNARVFNITTNKTVRKLVQDTTNDLTSSSQLNKTSSTSSSDSGSVSTNNKDANRQMTMKTTGASGIDNLVKWEDGASAIGENKGSTSTSNSGSSSITAQDVNALRNIGTGNITSKDKYEAVNGQAVDLIKKIWNYIAEPKALEWFCHQLESAFILVY